MEFSLPLAAWKLRFEPAALEVIKAKAQSRCLDPEAVGQIYSPDIASNVVSISVATLLKPARARRTGIVIDKNCAAEERKSFFSQGLHCVGIWHSHPEAVPEPSMPDKTLAGDYAKAASKHVTGIIFVIIGTAKLPEGLGVWVHDGVELQKMQLML